MALQLRPVRFYIDDERSSAYRGYTDRPLFAEAVGQYPRKPGNLYLDKRELTDTTGHTDRFLDDFNNAWAMRMLRYVPAKDCYHTEWTANDAATPDEDHCVAKVLDDGTKIYGPFWTDLYWEEFPQFRIVDADPNVPVIETDFFEFLEDNRDGFSSKAQKRDIEETLLRGDPYGLDLGAGGEVILEPIGVVGAAPAAVDPEDVKTINRHRRFIGGDPIDIGAGWTAKELREMAENIRTKGRTHNPELKRRLMR